MIIEVLLMTIVEIINKKKNKKALTKKEVIITEASFNYKHNFCSVDILVKKADEGLDVRVIYDDFGCIQKMSYKHIKMIKKTKIKFYSFNPPIKMFICNKYKHVFSKYQTIITKYSKNNYLVIQSDGTDKSSIN